MRLFWHDVGLIILSSLTMVVSLPPARVNSVMFYLLWTCAPILVSIVSFFVFVMQGGKLTISVAFTVGSLFSRIRYDR